MSEWPWGQIVSHALILACSLMSYLSSRSVSIRLNGHLENVCRLRPKDEAVSVEITAGPPKEQPNQSP